MFHTDNIEAIDILQKKLPDELQDWHRWGNISELHYYKEMYSEEYCDYICCIELILRDVQEKYAIKLSLFNVSGGISFDMDDGFFSGLTIEDCSDWGYEKDCGYRISSLEEDIEFEIYCEKIKVELIC